MSAGKCPKKVIAIVEGDGEVEAVPVLLNRWFHQRGLANEIGTPKAAISAYSRNNLKKDLERYIRIALTAKPAAIVVVIDSDSDPDGPDNLRTNLYNRATKVAEGVPVSIVVAVECYEAWFMASIELLQKAHPGLIKPKVKAPARAEAIETIIDCKDRFERMLIRKYVETKHQPQLSESLPFEGEALDRMPPSYKRLLTELERLTGLHRRSASKRRKKQTP